MRTKLDELLKEVREATDASKLVDLATEGTYANVVWAATQRAVALYSSPVDSERAQGKAYFDQIINGKDMEAIRYACTELMDLGLSVDEIRSTFYHGPELPRYYQLEQFFRRGSFPVSESEMI